MQDTHSQNTQEQFLALKASAGSGKTFSLSLRFIYLLFQGANPHQILTLTFTKKASNEMRHRIYFHLKSLYESIQRGDFAQNDVYQTLKSKGLSDETMQQNIARIYAEFKQSNPRIETIDAFFNAVLKKFCWYVGISAYFEIGELSNQALYEQFLSMLSAQDLSDCAQLCFYDGAISLKKFLEMLSEFCFLPHEVAAQFADVDYDVQELAQIEAQILEKMQVIHNFINKQPDIHGRARNLFNKSSVSKILESTPNMLLQWRNHTYLQKLATSSLLDDTRDEILNLLMRYFTIKEGQLFARYGKYLQTFKRAKTQQIRSQNLLSFNDVMIHNYELLKVHTDRDFFHFRLDDKIAHILLDEFQDTSIMQYQILTPIIKEITSGEGRIGDRSVFIVGDEKQSIYRFRGSFLGVFEAATKNMRIQNLPYNYRSKPRVIDFNNATFEPYFNHYIHQQYPSKQEHLNDGYVRIFEASLDNQALQERVYTELMALLDKGANPNDIAILTFKNDDIQSIKEYIQAKSAHLSIITEESSSLFDKTEVKILLCALEYITLRAKMLADNPSLHLSKSDMQAALKLCEKKIIKLLGKPYAQDVALAQQFPSLTLPSTTLPATALLALIEEFNIAQSTSLRLLELSCAYNNIADFLDMCFSSRISAPSSSNEGIKMMTIHKSKGLEFEYVILCDNLSGQRGDTQSLIFAYDEANIARIYRKIKNREHFDSAYKQALEEHKIHIQQEKYNLLYVAFTRAKHGLSIIKKHQSSMFDILNLSPRCDEISILDSIPAQTHIQNPPRIILEQMHSLGTQSDFIKQDELLHKDITTPQQWRNIIFGYALHSAFELYLGYDMPRVDIEHILFNRYGFALNTKSIAQALHYATTCIQNAFFTQLRSAKDIMCEVRFITQGRLYRIDALLRGEKECIILDYKSSANEQALQAKQVQMYMQFLESIYQTKAIRGFIVYPLKHTKEQFYEVH